ncbi:substrate-binding domain-containing protein [Nonomuraea polychroma]|uniref:substrate-binding domain-containing protein n=1 Tax=Nonomuraea polychroma TaxID=46176 RepID=UPI0013E2993C|nr:substrate-binding domain-containing protein [Nonomuraea polychroma]
MPLLALALAGCSNASNGAGAGSSALSTEPAAAASGAGLQSGLGGRAQNRKITFLLSQDPGDSFWGTISQGAKDAAELFNVELNLQTSQGDPGKYNDLIGSAVADKPAALAVVIDDPKRYTENVCAASKAGIAVLAYNITQEGDVAACTSGFVGQNFEEAGFLLGRRLIAEAKLPQGAKVFTPVEFPEQVYAIQRNAGVQKALDAIGAKTEMVATGIDDAGALDKMSQYLLGHKDIAAIVPLGGTPHRNIEAAMTDVGVKVPVVGFDLSKPVIDGIKSGTILAAADQQPYIQGFQTVAQLALKLDFDLSPATINSGGGGLVDKSNVAIVEQLAGTIR